MITDFPKRMFKSRFFLQSFCLIMGILTILFLLISMIVFQKSRTILEQEFIASSQYGLEVSAQAMDNYFMDMRYLAATLDTNQMVQAFFAFPDPGLIYDDFYGKIQENLKAYVNGYSSIDSIYLYSQCSDTILTATERTTTNYFSDRNWMDSFVESPDGFQIFFRAKNNAFPYVLCLMKQIKIKEYDAAIVINLNLNKLSHLSEMTDSPYQEIFIVSDEGTILFRNRQRELVEPLSIKSELQHFDSAKGLYSVLVSKQDSPYTYSQVPSKDYPWNYVLVTHLQEYTKRLSSSRAMLIALFLAVFFATILLAFLFSLHSVKPIQNLLRLIHDPKDTLSKELYSDTEIGYIADQITSYIQQNQTLSDELSTRLNLLNETKLLALQTQINPHFLFNTLNMIHIQESEALGYDHMIPKITLNLSKLLRYAMESTDLVTLETELQYTKLYLSILQHRYGNNLNVVYHIDNEVLATKVPKLFIQPLLENAVFHGLAENMTKDSTLTLCCKKEGENCVVSVTDNGVGMSSDVVQHLQKITEAQMPLKGSIGLKNIVTRMNLLYGDAFTITIQSTEGKGSIFTLTFPINQ